MKSFSIKSVINFLKDHTKAIIFFLCFSILNIFFLCWSFKSTSHGFSSITFIVLLLATTILEIASCILLYYSKKHHWPVEKLFLILGLAIGSFYVLALPVGRAPDEASHFFRIYEITDGHLISTVTDEGSSTGSILPSNINIVADYAANNVTYQELLSDISASASEETEFIRTSAYGYNFISYLPQVTGMLIGKALHLPFLISAYLAKFANLIFCIIILYFCIKYTPFLKNFIFLTAFLPISMQAMSSLSADAPIFVSAIALLVFILHAIYTRKKPLAAKDYLLVLALCILITIGKIVYAPICLLLFAIPKERFGTMRTKLTWIFTLGFITVAAYLIWFAISPDTITVSDSSTQISSIIQHPIHFLAIVLRSISTNFMLYLSGTLGGFLEWFNVVPSMFYIMSSLVIIVSLCIRYRSTYSSTKSLKYLSIFIIFSVVFITFTAMYVTWTKAGETIIDGVQGRYFLPILDLIPIALLPTSSKIAKPTTELYSPYLYAFFIFESIYALTTIICTHI